MNNVVSVQLHFILTICTKNKIWGGYFPVVANFYEVNFIFYLLPLILFVSRTFK